MPNNIPPSSQRQVLEKTIDAIYADPSVPVDASIFELLPFLQEIPLPFKLRETADADSWRLRPTISCFIDDQAVTLAFGIERFRSDRPYRKEDLIEILDRLMVEYRNLVTHLSEHLPNFEIV